MAERFLRMTRKWLEGAAVLRQETVTRPFTKITGKRADELIGGSSSKSDAKDDVLHTALQKVPALLRAAKQA